MKPWQSISSLLFLGFAIFYLTGCGQSGPLYLPPATNPSPVTASS